MTKVAVVGATGAVGRQMLCDLEACSIPDLEVLAFASPRSAGESLEFRGGRVQVAAFSHEALRGIPYVLMSAGGGFSREHSPQLAKAGAVVIDNSSAFRMDDDVPLVVPEINGVLARDFRAGIIANPNCSTIQMVVALKPLQERFGLKHVHVATYQSVSGSGQKGISELIQQVEQVTGTEQLTPANASQAERYTTDLYEQAIAFNLLPAIDVFDDQGHAFEEVKMVRETRKIFQRPNLPVVATTVRVPTVHCHGEAVTVQLAEEVTRSDVLEAFDQAGGLTHVRDDNHKSQPTPHRVKGEAEVFVSRVRLPYGESQSDWVGFWNIADNLKKGAATNAVQILVQAVRSR